MTRPYRSRRLIGKTNHCTKCGEDKHPKEFSFRPSGRLASWCRECKKVWDQAARARKRAHAAWQAGMAEKHSSPRENS